jgi:catechol 2,3-dioxygenase-like lactoylglutathione lyase family enzyme
MLLRVWDVTFSVSDLDQAVDFYGRVLDLPKKYQFSSYAGFDCGGVEIGLAPGKRTGHQAGEPLVDFLVQDVDAVYRMLVDRDVRFLKKPHETVWGGRIALFADPDGNRLQLVQIDWPRYLAVCAPR